MSREQKITFGEMRGQGVRGFLIYCADHKCSHSTANACGPLARSSKPFRHRGQIQLPHLRKTRRGRQAGFQLGPHRASRRNGLQEDLMSYAEARPSADPEAAARHLMEIANAIEPVQGKIYIELINYPMLFKDGASPAEYWAGLQHAIAKGWLKYHESGTFVTFTPAGADLFA